jgi:transposase
MIHKLINMTKLMHDYTRTLLIGVIDHELPYEFGRRQQFETGHYLDVIMKVLRIGMQWKMLNEKLNWSTYYKKFKKWTDNYIFEKTFCFLTKTRLFQESIGNDFYIDSCIIQNKRGLKNEMIGLSYKHKFKNGTKITVISDIKGKPISLHFSKANESDIKFVLPAYNKIKIKSKVKILCGDKGYCSRDLRLKFESLGVDYIYPDRSNILAINRINADENIMRKRMAVEHTFSWLLQYRKLSI